MTKAQERQVAKLEQVFKIDDRIPVYVKHEEDFQKRVDELIAVGTLAEADRPRCVFWLDYRHYSKWQVDDEHTRRLNAQAVIKMPCSTLAGRSRTGSGGETP